MREVRQGDWMKAVLKVENSILCMGRWLARGILV